jgi:hypothetical protein
MSIWFRRQISLLKAVKFLSSLVKKAISGKSSDRKYKTFKFYKIIWRDANCVYSIPRLGIPWLQLGELHKCFKCFMDTLIFSVSTFEMTKVVIN